jgi:predicted HD superfamily hydrolase involved in NAD metabolism
MREYEIKIRERLTEKRYEHVCAVRHCAAELAKIHGLDRENAELAGLLHDYARDMDPEQLLAIGRSRNLITCKVEEQFPILLHGPVGAALVEEELGVAEVQVLEAVALHTVAGPAIGRLAQMIYIADLIAAGRDFPGVDYLRSLAVTNLRQALPACIASSIRCCLERGRLIHPQTIEAWNYYSIERKE